MEQEEAADGGVHKQLGVAAHFLLVLPVGLCCSGVGPGLPGLRARDRMLPGGPEIDRAVPVGPRMNGTRVSAPPCDPA